MIRLILLFSLLTGCLLAGAQTDSASLEALGRSTVLSPVVIRNGLNVYKFLELVKEDTTFYKAFRNLRVLQFKSINDIQMRDKKGKTKASLWSRTFQKRSKGCRTMEVLEERTTGDMYKDGALNYMTADLYASLFFTRGSVCGETNIVGSANLDARGKSGMEKHKEQLRMLFFNPGKKIPGIPFIGDKIDIFSPEISQYYDFSIDLENKNGVDCYLYTIKARTDLTSSEKDNIVFDNIITWFNAANFEIVARTYDLSFDTPVYNFDVHMDVQMEHFGDYLVPRVLVYNGNWKVAFKKRESSLFVATLYDFQKE